MKNKDLHANAKGLAIDYTYLEVKEDDGLLHSFLKEDTSVIFHHYLFFSFKKDILTRINVWQLEGEREHDLLLKFALNAENIHKSVILITLDFTKPWNLIQELENWLETVQKHIKSLRLTSKVLEPMKNKCQPFLIFSLKQTFNILLF